VDKELRAVANEPPKVSAQQLPSVFAEDLAYTPPHSYLVAVMRPAKMSALKGVQEIPGMDLAGSNPFKPSEVERVVAAVYPQAANQSLGIGVAVQLRVLVPREKMIARLSPQAEAFAQEPWVYVHPEWDPDSLVLGFPDDHTILVSYDPEFVFERVRGASSNDLQPHSLATAFADIDPRIGFVVDRIGNLRLARCLSKTAPRGLLCFYGVNLARHNSGVQSV
jgi:hypothetical protein